MSELKPYPEYKDSGVPWLGKVPPHWKVERLKSLMSNIITQATKQKTNDFYIALENVESWTGRLRKTGFDVPSDSQVKQFRSGDILFGRLRPYLAKVTRPMMDGVCVGEFLVLRPRISSATSSYMEQLLRSYTIIEAINSSTFGAKMPRADWQFIGGMAVTLPTLPEQATIVRFLDHMDRRIRRYIRAKQKLIRLLEEQKQAIIHHAVTRGLYPSVPFKPSGVEWLGDIPEHWEICRLKQVATIQTGLTLGKNHQDTVTRSYPYLRVANVQHGRLDLDVIKHINVPPEEAARSSLKNGDVLMTEGGDIDKLGRGCVWQEEIPNCLHQNHIFAVRCSANILLPKMLVWLIVSGHGRAYFQLTAKQTTNLASTNTTILRSFPVLLPPIEEQRAILEYIDSQAAIAESLIENTNHNIAFLLEYRARLISDVVTGKLDVRGVNLPAAEEVEAPEEYTDLPESEEIMGEDLQEEIPAEGDLDEQ